MEEGHCEGDTMVGKRAGKESVVLSLVEKKTENHLDFLIPGKTSDAVMPAMRMLKGAYGDRFAQVFKTITVDNGSEFADFAQFEEWGTEACFAHPFTSWERAQNKRHNGLFRAFVLKGTSMVNYSADYILDAADELNALPRKKLGYCTPEELFDSFLDRIYAVDSQVRPAPNNFYRAGVQLALAIFAQIITDMCPRRTTNFVRLSRTAPGHIQEVSYITSLGI